MSGENITQLEQLKRGESLPCGCKVMDTAWTREEARIKTYKRLAEVLNVSEVQAAKIPEGILLRELPLSTKSLRRLRDKFWFPDGSLGSEEGRDAEEGETVLGLPKTIGDFITKLLEIHSGISYYACASHGD